MPDAAPNPTPAPSDLAWRVIGLTSLYRLLLPPALLILQGLASPGILARAADPELFRIGVLPVPGRRCAADSGAALATPQPEILALVNATVDTLAISLILYTSGGAGSGLGILLVLPVGAMALLGRTKDAFLVPAIATLGLLAQQIAANLAGYAPPTDYTTAGHARRGAVRHRPVRLAHCRSAARKRSAGAAPGDRPRQPRAALPLHRPAPAREHPRRGYQGPDPPDQ